MGDSHGGKGEAGFETQGDNGENGYRRPGSPTSDAIAILTATTMKKIATKSGSD
jgi:hypothetical protein